MEDQTESRGSAEQQARGAGEDVQAAERVARTAGSVAGGITGAAITRTLVPVPLLGPVLGAVVGATVGSELGRRLGWVTFKGAERLGRATVNGGTAFVKTLTS